MVNNVIPIKLLISYSAKSKLYCYSKAKYAN